ncbi:vascular endothelial growth factor receptor 2 [Melanotaenia boesemani]|uniref:vascular endothelial growth factor receptor 2 n=1 Tax=Melanotaenia boesemani TaxID=1250792 RepID=UPI001C059BEE|nr:vascular endothelial growth factor receptor 2 [Melanotaenia boesemani]
MMAQALSVIPFLVFILETTCVAAIELRFMPDPPTLNIYGTYRMNKSDNLELTCRGRQVLKWSKPPTSTHFSMSDCSGSGLFCTRLKIINATVNETGQYRCHYEDMKVEDGKTAATLYVFVHDYKVPFVPSEKEYEVVLIREGERVVIPCRGSVEDLNVTLNTKYPIKELHPDGKDSVWDAKTGFTVPSHLISYAGVVSCHTWIGNETFKSPLYIVAVVGYKIYDLTLTPTQQRLSVGERLELSCTAHTELNVGIEFNWTHSGGMLNLDSGSKSYYTVSHKNKLWKSLELFSTLIVGNVTVDHTGEFTCTASSGQMEKSATASLKVYEKPFLDMKEPWPKILEANVADQIPTVIPVKYSAYPEPNIKWLKNGQELKEDYRIKQRSNTLTIYGVTKNDSGNYTVILSNKITKEEQRRSFQLLVNVPSHIFEKELPVNTVYPYGDSHTLSCTAGGFPIPAHIQWQWMSKEDCPEAFLSVPIKSDMHLEKCKSWRDISNSTGPNHVERISFDIDHDKGKITSTLKIQKAEVHALYRCRTANKAGEDSLIIFFRVTRSLEVSMSPPDEPLEEDDVVLRCKADKLFYKNLAWFLVTNVSESEQFVQAQPCQSLALQPVPLSQTSLFTLHGTNVTLELTLPNASRWDEGLYACQVQNIKTSEKTCLLRRLSLRTLEATRIRNNFTEQKVNVSATITLHCEAAGTPKPIVVWTKNNHTVVEGSGVILNQHNLTIQRVKKEDSGLYTCTACNSRGCDTSQAYLAVEGAEEKTNVELIVPIGSVVIAMFFWLLIVFVIRGRKRPNGGDLKTGYLSMILDSEDMPMDEQCERLTYDANKWEFPRDRLKLGEPLGRGAFGQVVEAAAFGIEKATTCTTVAVKMLKEGATTSEYRALMSELKILIHIGHHLNVVNLLGACTKPGGPLMVIVEYCKHGNLSSYLKSKRGEYSPYKRKRVGSQRWTSAEEDVTEGDLGLGKIAQLDICTGTAEDKTSGSHMETQEESSVDDHLTMEDLISYSFQVAKGMDFLSSRKCIHRDLAARNILLSENNVVKICDFGLARDVYKDPDYVRKGDARLPLKWMAPETIFDRVYTTQSDVWSFGVLLWEIFSLGASPYPGVCIDESFCRRLKEGTRMRPPEYATTEIYQTMLDCWLDHPTDRPTFAELVEHLGSLLQASAQQDGKDYIPLTADEAEGCPVPIEPRVSYSRPQSGEILENHYDSPQSLGLSQQSERCSRPLSVKTFEDIPVAHSSVMEGRIESGMGFCPDEVKRLNQQLPTTPNFSQLLRCKSKESLASESSNQTSGYQSGYHSDDTDTPIYANEEMIMKHTVLKKPPLPKTPDKFSSEIRYSAPPV